MSTRIGRPLRLAIIGLAAVAVVVVVIRVGTSDSDVVPATGAALEQSSVSTGPAKVEERGAARKQSIVPAEQAARPTEGIDPAVSRQHDLLSQEAAEPVSVEPDPDFQTALSRSFISTNGWRTDFSRHTVPFGEIVSGGPQPDGIPPLDSPTFVDTTVAATWLGEREPVIALEIDGDVRAYPLQILIWHEIVNDVVGGEPVTVTFCPLCNAAIVFERTLDGVVYDFGTSGYLRHSDLIMWDRQTHSWWQQFTGEGIIGDLAGRRLTFVPAPIVSFSDFESANPDGLETISKSFWGSPESRHVGIWSR